MQLLDFHAKTLTGISSTYQPYYSQMIDCACQTGSAFSTTDTNTLYVDNATWIKSNGCNYNIRKFNIKYRLWFP